MTAHTPGPWFFDIDIRTEGGEIVASGDWDGGVNASLANQRLIAAAPDLLEALQGIMRDLVRGPDPFGTMAKARAAIAKATGTQA